MKAPSPAMTRSLGLAVVAAVVGLAILVVGSGGRERAQADSLRRAPGLHPLGSCDHLRSFLRRHRAPSGGAVAMPGVVAEGGASYAPTGADQATSPTASPTNVQEQGVDEPDIVKTAGGAILTVDGTTLRAVTPGAGAPVLGDRLELPAGPDGAPIGGYELIGTGDRMLAIGTGYGYPMAGDVPTDAVVGPGIDFGGKPRTVLAEIDVSDPSSLRLVRTMTIDGSYVSARLTGSTVRLVSSSASMPHFRLRDRLSGGRRSGKLVPCGSVARPSRFAGAGMLSVLTVDLERGLPAVDVDTVLTDGDMVYASPTSLYIATERWTDGSGASGSQADTEIHRFDIADPERTEYVASGAVTGYMLSQWSMSEADGLLRVASTSVPPMTAGGHQADNESFVSVLALDGDRMRVVGRVGDLGRGEDIYAVRFAGDLGYVVTFRQVDPLYVLDLADPTDPRVAGELKLPGYSSYLHPVGPGLLLGVGRQVGAGGVPDGLQASLFDVSDPAAPLRLDRESFGHDSTSEVEYDHHAFSFFDDAGIAALPIDSYSDWGTRYAVAGLRVLPGDADPLRRVAKPATRTPVQRTLELDGRIYAIETGGIGVFDPATMAPLGTLRY